jgi:hypothetical protein
VPSDECERVSVLQQPQFVRLTPSWLAFAANVWFPPFMSKCAWCSILTAPYLIIVTHGPNRTFTTGSTCCSAAPHCSHSCGAQHFKLVRLCANSNGEGVCGSRAVRPAEFLLSQRRCTKASNCLTWKRNRPTEQKVPVGL